MKIYFITTNKGKWRECQEATDSYEIERINMTYPEIQADSLQQVIRYGLYYLTKKVDGMFIIEDSGLFIQALNGFPGVFSAYVFKSIGNKGILRLMEGIKERKASFQSIIGMYDGEVHLFEGKCNGNIAYEKRGNKGFGYDPLFIPHKSEKTFGEMKIHEKNKFSHRGIAIRNLLTYLKTR